MALDEFLFGKIANYFKNRNQVEDVVYNRTIRLDDIKAKLTILSRAFTAKPIEIYPAEREGGYKNNSFFLPASFGLFATRELNLSFYYFRILYLAEQSEQQLNWNSKSKKNQLETDQQKALDSSELVLAELYKKYPVTVSIFEELKKEIFALTQKNQTPDLSWLFGKWMINDLEVIENSKLKNIGEEIKKSLQTIPTTTLKAKPVEEVISIEIDKKQQEDYVMTHNFEKVETADEFSGNWRDFDGDDELEDHQAALDELNMKFTVRVDDAVHSVYQSDFIENTTISESEEVLFNGNYISYPEWNYQKNVYSIDFCKLYAYKQLKTNLDFYRKTIQDNNGVLLEMRKSLTNLNNKIQQLPRQNHGSDYDIDAMTDALVDIHARKTPSDKIYIANRKKEKDLSILLLLDISLSSDGYADGNRVIDVEKQVSILFGEILNEFDIDFSIACFYSKTRNYSSYLTVKSFDDKWDKTKYKIGAIEPQGYTRIGAALRHSKYLLEERKTKNKWVILLSDGKPNDFDRYEGKYGINDVKKAINELYASNINAYALAIEAQARYYLPQMFGQNHYQILTTPKQLLTSLVHLFDKIKFKS